MARDEEIFRKLKKQTPLVKRADIQPLSPQDFDGRKSGMTVNRPIERKTAPKAVRAVGAASKKAEKRGAELAERYNSARRQSGKKAELGIFGEDAKKNKPSGGKVQRQPERPDSLEFHTPAKAPRQAADRSGIASHTDLHDLDYLRMPVQNTFFANSRLSVGAEPEEDEKLEFRHELKFYINYHDYVLLRNTLKALLPVDRNANADGQYFIRSVYFDDVYETSLVEKLSGVEDRSKFRIRFYNFNDNVIRFEKKIKREQFISKASICLSRDDCDSLMAGDCGVLEGRREPLAGEIYLQMKNNSLKPRVIVDYWREAYVSPLENVRITFDKDIKGGLGLTDIFSPSVPTMPALDEGFMVLEVKFRRYLPEYIKAVLSNVNTAQRSAISKYVLCRKFE